MISTKDSSIILWELTKQTWNLHLWAVQLALPKLNEALKILNILECVCIFMLVQELVKFFILL